MDRKNDSPFGPIAAGLVTPKPILRCVEQKIPNVTTFTNYRIRLASYFSRPGFVPRSRREFERGYFFLEFQNKEAVNHKVAGWDIKFPYGTDYEGFLKVILPLGLNDNSIYRTSGVIIKPYPWIIINNNDGTSITGVSALLVEFLRKLPE